MFEVELDELVGVYGGDFRWECCYGGLLWIS